MSEAARTAVYVAIAVVASVVAIATAPRGFEVGSVLTEGKMFPKFTDVQAATALEIVRIKDGDDAPNRLRIANVDGVWSITSHKSYPADGEDAETKLRNAAINLMDLEMLGKPATEQASDHRQYGVISPEDEAAKLSSDGVGLLVTVEDAENNPLASLVIGKEVKDSPGVRFVRRPGQDVTFVVQLDIASLSTDFADWIEDDLLSLSKLDVETIQISDYNFGQQFQLSAGGLVPSYNYERRLDVTLSWNNDTSKWSLDKFLEYRGETPVASTLLNNEELDAEKIDAMVTALDELKIIDVVSKPAGLGGDLSADESLLADRDSLQSLMGRGFYPVELKGQPVILSSDGDVRVLSNAGIRYTLRFGKTASIEEGEDETKLNRYMLVTADLDASVFEVPQAPAAAPTGEAPPVDPLSSRDADSKFQLASFQVEAGDEAGANDAPVPPAPAEGQDTPTAAADDAKPEEGKIDPAQAAYELALDEYNEKIKTAEDAVKELNDRFGDWYYVISEDTFKKIHLGRFDIIKEADDSLNIEAFRELEQGIETKDDSAPAGLPGGLGLPSGLGGLPPNHP